MKTPCTPLTQTSVRQPSTGHFHRLLSLALVLVLLVPLLLQLAGCSKKQAIDPELAELAVYDAIEYEIGNQYSYVQSIIWANNEIVALASDNSGVNSLLRLSTDGKLLGTVPLAAIPGLMTDPAQPSSAYLDGVFAGPNGSLLVTATDYSDPMKSVRPAFFRAISTSLRFLGLRYCKRARCNCRSCDVRGTAICSPVKGCIPV